MRHDAELCWYTWSKCSLTASVNVKLPTTVDYVVDRLLICSATNDINVNSTRNSAVAGIARHYAYVTA